MPLAFLADRSDPINGREGGQSLKQKTAWDQRPKSPQLLLSSLPATRARTHTGRTRTICCTAAWHTRPCGRTAGPQSSTTSVLRATKCCCWSWLATHDTKRVDQRSQVAGYKPGSHIQRLLPSLISTFVPTFVASMHNNNMGDVTARNNTFRQE